ncbi:MAG: hypothetical protein MUF34_20105 [Polyangiaceae bacterium]|jgi:hypothetical protein|nr:hypothetical protein [Polyangiaceae bacterium]
MHAIAVGLAAVALALAACREGFYVDPTFCSDHPGNAACPAPAGAAGGAGAAGADGAGASGEGGGQSGLGGSAGLGGASGAAGAGSGGAGGLACAAPEVGCDGACVDLKASDAENCGACGRSCRSATCEAGACVPEALTAGGEVAPYALADDGTSLYWVSPAVKAGVGPRLRRAPKATPGGASEALFPNVDARARSLAATGGKLYWGELGASQGVFSGTPGATFPDAPFAADQLDVRHLAVADGKAFWSVGGSAAVRGKALAGGAIDPSLLGQDAPGWVAADEAGALYWVAGVTREVRRAKAAAPGYETFAAAPGVVAVELAGERVYWADAAAGTVRSALKTDAPPVAGRVEFGGHGRVEGFRVEGGTLYVLALDGGALGAWRKGEGDEEPLLLGKVAARAVGYAGNPFGAARVLVDATHVYFADPGTVDVGQVVPESQGDGAVYRVAR